MKNKLELVLSCFVFCLSIITVNGCKKKGSTTPTNTTATATAPIPFQGPKNPSFETYNTNWVTTNPMNPTFNPGSSYLTGTGFLPSQGIYYLSFSSSSSLDQFYQDNVDFTKSTTMSFDYTFSILNRPKGVQVISTVKILFTSNGTVTLWEKTIDSTSAPIQKLTETITLPSTTSPGRLLIQGVTTVPNINPLAAQSEMGQFNIDNIKVK